MTAPYYQDAFVTLYLGRAEETPEWLAADVLVCDPPYGIAYKSGARRETVDASIEGDLDTRVRDELLSQWGDRPALIFGTWRIPKPAGVKQLLIWDKRGALGMGDTRLPWKPGHEEIYVLGDGGAGWRGDRTNDVLSFAPVQSIGRNGRIHPHQKPVPLMQELVRKAPPGVVADATAGVGTTLIAAANLGQQAIGVEVSERHAEKAAKRFEKGYTQDLMAAEDLAREARRTVTVPFFEVTA